MPNPRLEGLLSCAMGMSLLLPARSYHHAFLRVTGNIVGRALVVRTAVNYCLYGQVR